MGQYIVDVQREDRIHEVQVSAGSEREANIKATNYIADQYDKLENIEEIDVGYEAGYNDFNQGDYRFATGIKPIDATVLGFGRTGDKLLAGISSIFSNEAGKAQINAEQQAADQAYAPVSEAHPVSAFVGETIPYMTPIGGGLRGMVAGQSILAGLGHEQGGAGDQAVNAAISGGLTAAIPYGAGKAMNAIRGPVQPGALGALPPSGSAPNSIPGRNPTVDPDIRNPLDMGPSQTVNPRLVQRADEIGYKITPGERTGNKTLQKLEAGMESYPYTSGMIDDLRQKNQQTVNRLAGESIGLKTESITGDQLGTAAQRISDVFTSLTNGKKRIEISDGIVDKMFGVIDDSKRGLNSIGFGGDDVEGLVGDILDQSLDGSISASQYQRFSSQIGSKIQALYKGDLSNPDLAKQLGSIKSVLDDAVEQSLGGDDLAKFRHARKLWKNLVTLEKPGVLRTETGDVSARTLANRLAKQDKRGYRYEENTSDLYDAARMSQQFRPPVGDSGTATRLSWSKALRDAPMVAPLALGMGAKVLGHGYLAGSEGVRGAFKNNRIGRLASGAINYQDNRPEDELEARGYR